MAIPSGGGSEILQRGWFPALTGNDVYALFTGVVSSTTTSNAVPAHNIISIISMVFNERGGANELLNVRVKQLGSTDNYIISKQSIPAWGTFIWNETLVLHATDKLVFGLESSGNVDLRFDFIRQDWSS